MPDSSSSMSDNLTVSKSHCCCGTCKDAAAIRGRTSPGGSNGGELTVSLNDEICCSGNILRDADDGSLIFGRTKSSVFAVKTQFKHVW